MDPSAATAIACLTSYLAGSVPFGLVLGRLRGVDVRSVGSGNIGATNVTRALGRPWGVAVFVLDFAKGGLPVLAVNLLEASGRVRFALAEGGWHLAMVSCAAILGHCASAFLRLRGGKGVATAFGAAAALWVWSFAAAAATWLVTYKLTRVSSVASLLAVAAIAVAFGARYVSADQPPNLANLVFSLAANALVVIRHRSNLARLWRGEELTFRRRSSSS